MKTAIRCNWICLLVLGTGCGQVVENPDESDEQAKFAETSTSASAGTEASARAPASYFATLVVDSDGERYTDGDAIVQIKDVDDTAQITLSIQAWNALGKSWSAQMALSEEALFGERVELDFDGRPDAIQVRSGAAKEVERPQRAKLALSRVASAGKRPFLQGAVDREAAGRAEFTTEYSVECLVPPQALGLIPNGSPDPDTPILGVFVVDERFETSFCQSFAAIR